MEILSAGGTKETSVCITLVSFKEEGTSGRQRQGIVLGHLRSIIRPRIIVSITAFER